MVYTVQKLAALAGVSARTLRYYDKIGLLAALKNDSGYRIYRPPEVDRLQQILFYRELGFGLGDIAKLLDDPHFDEVQALSEHRRQLIDERSRLDLLIQTVEMTISAKKGESDMNDYEKFEGFKRQMVEDNEAQFGAEVRDTYGNRLADDSNAKMLNMTESQYKAFRKLEQDILDKLTAALPHTNPAGEAGQEIAALHREWLSFTWSAYDPVAHKGLADMYVADERFTAYYDKAGPEAAQFLHAAIAVYTGKSS